jgi:hypothetical protein
MKPPGFDQAIDDDFRANIAQLRSDPGDLPACGVDSSYGAVLENPDAPALCPARQGLCGINGVGPSIPGQIDRPCQIARLQQRPHLRGFAGAQDINLEAEGTGHRCTALELLQQYLLGKEFPGLPRQSP